MFSFRSKTRSWARNRFAAIELFNTTGYGVIVVKYKLNQNYAKWTFLFCFAFTCNYISSCECKKVVSDILGEIESKRNLNTKLPFLQNDENALTTFLHSTDDL